MFDNIKRAFNNLFQQKLLLPFALVVALSLFILVLIISIWSPRTESPQNSPTPTPASSVDRLPREQRISVIQKSAIEKTTEREVADMPGLENKSTLADGSTRYTFNSPLLSRKNEIITKDGTAVFERIIVPEKSKDPGYARISAFISRYGQPQKTIKGSVFYGELISTFIYADKGFTLIGNPRTDEVFEIQIYAPMPIDQYSQQFGEDIKEHSGPVL